jgi:DNA-binding transcriptional regulator YiaG
MPILCSVCRKGTLQEGTVPEHNIGPTIGIPIVLARRVPGLICDQCGAVSLTGAVLEPLMAELTRVLLGGSFPLDPDEACYLRERLLMDEEELAGALGLAVADVIAWEERREGNLLGGAGAAALRGRVATGLSESLGPDEGRVMVLAFNHPSTTPPERPHVLDGEKLCPEHEPRLPAGHPRFESSLFHPVEIGDHGVRWSGEHPEA